MVPGLYNQTKGQTVNEYSKAPAAVLKRVTALRKKYHQELDKARVRLDILMVDTDAEDGSPLKHQGYPADGIARIICQRDRGAGRGDGEIQIDARRWKAMTAAEQDALLDHELQHFQVCKKDGLVVNDGNGRPKLKMRKHDVQVGWFDIVAKRHGNASAEVQQATALIERAGEVYLPGFDFLAKSEGKQAKASDKVVKMPSQAPMAAAAAK